MLTDAQVYCMMSMIYFDHHLPLKPSIGKRRKQTCTPNTNDDQKSRPKRLDRNVFIYMIILNI